MFFSLKFDILRLMKKAKKPTIGKITLSHDPTIKY